MGTVDLETSTTYELVLSVAHLALLVSPEDATAVLAEVSRTEALMPVVDPTGYRAIAANMADARRLVEAFIEFRRAPAQLVGEATQ